MAITTHFTCPHSEHGVIRATILEPSSDGRCYPGKAVEFGPDQLLAILDDDDQGDPYEGIAIDAGLVSPTV